MVVARYNEPLNWLRRVPAAIRVLVYNKCDDPEKSQAAGLRLLRNFASLEAG